MDKYIHKVQYYEEARVDFFDKVGYNYKKLEDEGIISPVIGVECNYKISTRFEDYVEIEVKVKEFKGVKLIFEYIMKKVDTEEIVATGLSKHCFVNSGNRPIILKKEFPELDKKLKELLEE